MVCFDSPTRDVVSTGLLAPQALEVKCSHYTETDTKRDSDFLFNGNLYPFLPPANEVRGKVMFSQVCVKSFCSGEGGLCPEVTEMTPCRDPPPGQRPPPFGKELAVRILLECILVSALVLITSIVNTPYTTKIDDICSRRKSIIISMEFCIFYLTKF